MKICIATGTRAEYGLLKPLIDRLRASDLYEIQLLVTGSHLSPEFGLTYKLIEEEGISIDAKVEMLLSSDTAQGIVKSMGLGMIGYADALSRLAPDLMIILGDRYEMLALASSALIFKIPIAHLHGGEITEGAYDDSIRHAITKLSHLHFTSTEAHKNRVIQMGERPDHVFNVGAIGLDNITNLPFIGKAELSEVLGIKFRKFNYLVTFHPETLDHAPVAEQFQILLQVLDQQEDSFFIFTKANADTSGRVINRMIDEYVVQHPDKAVGFTSMGQLRYLSTMRFVTAVVGNSSSGIIEAASFGIPTINIGDRQKGRAHTINVNTVGVKSSEIANAFNTAKDESYRRTLTGLINPYGNGHTAEAIFEIIKSIDIKNMQNKTFYNINY